MKFGMLSYSHTNPMEYSFTPVKRNDKLSNQVADYLQQSILSKSLKPGERLPTERELGDQFQVSRTVIREAIRILEARGLLDTQSGSGTYVKALQGEDVVNSLSLYLSSQDQSYSLDAIMEVRRVLELQVVKLAAERATQEDIANLEHICTQMEQTKNDTPTFSRWDIAFHQTLAQSCHNDLFEILIEPLHEIMVELIFTGSIAPGAVEEACKFHTDILGAIKINDADLSVQLMQAHLDQAQRAATEGLRIKKKQSHGER